LSGNHIKKWILFAVALVVWCWLPTMDEAKAKPVNYCKDEVSWQEWHELLSKHPDDDAICALYALFRGLCSMVKSGTGCR